MHDRGKLAVMTRLAAVQRAKRVGAEAALAQARRTEDEARAAEDEAHASLANAHRHWLDHMAEPSFSPEYGALLSNALVGCANDLDGAARETAATAEARARTQSEWQMLEARVRTSETSLKSFRRKVARRDEERRTAELADRTTYDRYAS